MKYSDEHVKKLIDGMLPRLNKTTFTVRKVTREGGELLAQGITETPGGDTIVRARKYEVSESVENVPDHEANIRALIKKSNSEKQMLNALAKYQRNHGHKPKTNF